MEPQELWAAAKRATVPLLLSKTAGRRFDVVRRASSESADANLL
jgi:hypothetical protein